MENSPKKLEPEIENSEEEKERDFGLNDGKVKENNERTEENMVPVEEKYKKSQSHSRSSSASSDSSVKSRRSRSKSKEINQHDDTETNTEKYKEVKTNHTKSESTDKKSSRSYRSEKSSKDQRRRSRSSERNSRGSRSYGHRSPRRWRRSRSRSRDRRSRSRDRRSRSRSRDRRERRSRSRERRDRRSRSRSRDRRERRSRSRSRDRYRRSSRYDRHRSRSRSRGRPRDFKEKALSNLRAVLEKTVKLDGEGLTVDASSLEKPSNLPLNVTAASVMTPQIVLQQAMAAMSAKAQALTGISLPKYYNPAAVNPLKYAEQVQKRKLLWQANKEKPEQSKPSSASLWENMTFAQDQDGKMTAKFRKLMGIKAEGNPSENAQEEEKEKEKPSAPDDVVKKQEALFRDLDQQYEMARMSTHTHRGVGLGYTSHTSNIYPPTAPK
ncbi:arginine/serine-rich coiled-coil protein 2-like isoform X1 [Centruroides vittatus]|uniref:arginine/serine-rich coiled-coil protein 2-like isoform X1 n=2 Tax=Centruroides vittatus TaxID=120091 RepID=UPI003510BF40